MIYCLFFYSGSRCRCGDKCTNKNFQNVCEYLQLFNINIIDNLNVSKNLIIYTNMNINE